jgi:hypothetical protein
MDETEFLVFIRDKVDRTIGRVTSNQKLKDLSGLIDARLMNEKRFLELLDHLIKELIDTVAIRDELNDATHDIEGRLNGLQEV